MPLIADTENPENNIEKADQQAAQIYAKYGGLTSAASVIATRAVIHSATRSNPRPRANSQNPNLSGSHPCVTHTEQRM